MIKLPSPKSPEYGLTLPLALLCLVLGAVLVIESALMRRGDSDAAPGTVQSNPAAAESGADADAVFELPPLEEFSAFVDRPLFLEGRRPVAEAETLQTPKEEDLAPLALSLMGVMLSPRGEWAILAEASGKNRRVKLGGSIAGWRLVALKPDHVTVQRGDEKRDLPLMKPRPKGPAAGAGQPAPVPTGATPPGVRRPPRQPVPPPDQVPEGSEPDDAEDSQDDSADMDDSADGEAEE